MKSAARSRATSAAKRRATAREVRGGEGRGRRPRWRLVAGLLLSFGLCLGAGLLVKREHQRRAARR